MSTDFTDLSEYNDIGELLNDFTARADLATDDLSIKSNTDFTGDTYLEWENTETGNNALTWDNKSGSDVEIFCRFRVTPGHDAVNATGPATLRWSSSDNYWYDARFSVDGVQIWRFDNFNALADEPFTLNVGTLYNFRCRANGNDLKFRAWEDGDPEPTEWTVETTDDEMDSGEAGLLFWTDETQFQIDAVGVGTDGNEAPTTDVARGEESVNLSWTDNATDNTGYRIYVEIDPDGDTSPTFPEDFALLDTVETPDLESYTDNEAANEGSIWYAVTAFTEGGGGDVVESDPALVEVTNELTGVVIIDGTPVEGAQVYATRVDEEGSPSELYGDITDSEGNFAIVVPPEDDWHVAAQHEDGGTYYAGESEPFQ